MLGAVGQKPPPYSGPGGFSSTPTSTSTRLFLSHRIPAASKKFSYPQTGLTKSQSNCGAIADGLSILWASRWLRTAGQTPRMRLLGPSRPRKDTPRREWRMGGREHPTAWVHDRPPPPPPPLHPRSGIGAVPVPDRPVDGRWDALAAHRECAGPRPGDFRAGGCPRRPGAESSPPGFHRLPPKQYPARPRANDRDPRRRGDDAGNMRENGGTHSRCRAGCATIMRC